MPLGFLTEQGPRPDLARTFGAAEHESPEFDARTAANIRDSDATLIFAGNDPSPGTWKTIEACREYDRPYRVVPVEREDGSARSRVAAWIADQNIRALNVAGDRESRTPGIEAKVEAFLAEVFREVRESVPGGP
jgi:hypothetical protein